MKQLLAIATVLIVIATIVAFIPAIATGVAPSEEKVPMVSLQYIQMGNGPFKSMESFHIHTGKSAVQRTENALNLSFASNLVSPINDTLSLNNSIHLSKNQMMQDFPVKNGTYRLIIPPQQSYLNRIAIVGNSSYSYLTIVESLPTQDIMVNGIYVNGTQEIQDSDIYNITMNYGSAAFVLHSPGLLQVGSVLAQVFMSINNAASNGRSLLSFSFSVKDGGFNVVLNQVLSSEQQITNDVMSYYQISPGFQSPLLYNLLSNSISLAAGGVIFLILILGLFIYYRRK